MLKNENSGTMTCRFLLRVSKLHYLHVHKTFPVRNVLFSSYPVWFTQGISQIPTRDGHPCFWPYTSRYWAYYGLALIKECSWRANKKSGTLIFRYLIINRSGKRDSNPWPSAWEADALPTELLPRDPFLTKREGNRWLIVYENGCKDRDYYWNNNIKILCFLFFFFHGYSTVIPSGCHIRRRRAGWKTSVWCGTVRNLLWIHSQEAVDLLAGSCESD